MIPMMISPFSGNLFPSRRKMITGLEISPNSIKFIEFSDGSAGITLENFGEIMLPIGAFTDGWVTGRHEFMQGLSELKDKYGWSEVAVAVPSLDEEAQEIYPKIFSEAGFKKANVEDEAKALARALSYDDEEVSLLINVGRTKTTVAIIEDGEVRELSAVSNLGGEIMDKNIRRAVGLSSEQAEKIRQENGLLRSTKNAVLGAILPVVSAITDEGRKCHGRWCKDDNELLRRPVKRIILCGGGANMPGLAQYIEESLGLPVYAGDPWCRLTSIIKNRHKLPKKDSLRFGSAIGTAMKNILNRF